MKKTYFASDFHLGIPHGSETARARELRVVRWLDFVAKDAEAIYLLGDVFDYWYEYKTVVPKGYTRLLGKLAELRDANIPIHFYIGNHDMWMFRYFEEELNIPIHRQPIIFDKNGKKFFLAHGDGLGPDDHGYKRLKKIFASPFFQWCFEKIHPDIANRLAAFWSGQSRHGNPAPQHFLGADQEWLLLYANKKLDQIPADFFIFGHRHLPLDVLLKNGSSRYINLGEWLQYFTYASFDGTELKLEYFEK